MAARRIRAALLRLGAPFQRRHPIVLGGATATDGFPLTFRSQHYPACNDRCRGDSHWLEGMDAHYVAERDPTDEAGA